MATIECCEYLSNSTKAKLQDVGVLYIADLTHLLGSDGDVGENAQIIQIIENMKRRVTRKISLSAQNEVALSNSNEKACAEHSGMRETDVIAVTPIDNISFFTDKEIDEVCEVVRATTRKSSVSLGIRGACRGTSDAGTSAGGPSCSSSCVSGRTEKKSDQHKTTAHIPGCQSLREILTGAKERRLRGLASHATTFSRELDSLLGGGVPIGGVTEVSGPPGVGKTQLLMQLAVSCAMPVEFGGLGGTSIFVDTEGSFVADRLEQMATAAVSLVKAILAKSEASHSLNEPAGRGDTAETQSVHSNGKVLPEEHSRKRTRPELSNPSVKTTRVDVVTPASTRAISSNKDQPANTLSLHAAADCGSSTYVSRGATETTSSITKPLTSHSNFTVESVLQRVQYVRVTELTDFLALLYSLPLWLQKDHSCSTTSPSPSSSTTATTTVTNGSALLRCEDEGGGVRMVLIDSVALPFRTSDAFEKNASSYDDPYSPASSGFTSPLTSGARAVAQGTLSKHGLWQRSRLLYQCSTALEELASSYELAVVVTNHMTTKLLTTTPGNGQALRDADGNNNSGHARETVLIPALGDAWGHGLSTRLLLTFHHYELPSCAFTSGVVDAPQGGNKGCQEDVVYTALTSASPSTASSLVSRVVQHRVARLLKASGRPRRETCFCITSKGIRDVHQDITKRVGLLQPSSSTSDGTHSHAQRKSSD